MRVGAYSLSPLLTGRFRLDGGAMFGIVPKALWSKPHPADEHNRIELVSRSLLVAGEGKLMLINTGIGRNWSEKERSLYGIDMSVDVSSSLGELGRRPEEVTHVINTHLHFDHAGGNTTAHGGSFRPTFPNAEYYVQKRHYEWARSPSERDRASFRPEAWECLEASGQLELVDGEAEILPGIFFHLVHGHTPFQQLPRITGGSTSVLYASDLVPFASQVKIPWVMGYDLRPVDTVREKQELLARAARESWLLFLEHDPAVRMCSVAQTPKGFEATERRG